MVEQGHLGGYVEGGDDATWYPELWQWFVKELGVDSVIDVGCGEGHSSRYFEKLGCEVNAIDGVESTNEKVFIWDYTEGPLKPQTYYDLVWCCEFVEHIEEQYIPNFLETFKRARIVTMTHAIPGQAGYHHVNCREREYWLGVMAAIGYQLDLGVTNIARDKARANRNPWNHFVRSGLVFVRGGLT